MKKTKITINWVSFLILALGLASHSLAQNLTYNRTTVYEPFYGDSSFPDSINVDLTGDTYEGANDDDFIDKGWVTVANLPAGLSATATRSSDTRVSLLLLGRAERPLQPPYNPEIKISFDDAAFTSGDSAGVTNAIRTVTLRLLEPETHWYVATASDGGDDNNNGLSPATPFATVAKAVSSANGAAADVVHIKAGVYTESGISVSSKSLLIIGEDRDSTILQASADPFDAGVANRLFTFSYTTSRRSALSVKNLTLRHGNRSGESSRTSYSGGAITSTGNDNTDAVLFVDNCRFDKNKTSAGGGAIYWSGNPDGYIINSTFDDNVSEYDGGAIWIRAAMLVSNCVFRGNSSLGSWGDTYGFGGGAYLQNNASASVIDSAFISNYSATKGGAIATYNPMTLLRCAIVDNTANTDGGAFSIGHTSYSKFTVINSVISGNHAGQTGGVFGPDNGYNAPQTFYNCTIVNNTAGNLGGAFYGRHEIALYSSIVMDNHASGAVDSDIYNIYSSNQKTIKGNHSILGAVVSDHANGPGADFTLKRANNNNLVYSEDGPFFVGLLPLGAYGGSKLPDGTVMPSVALEPGSVAIDAGTNTQSETTDIRGEGYARVVGVSADIGSYEYGSGPPRGTIIYLR